MFPNNLGKRRDCCFGQMWQHCVFDGSFSYSMVVHSWSVCLQTTKSEQQQNKRKNARDEMLFCLALTQKQGKLSDIKILTPLSVLWYFSNPGSLKKGSSTKIKLWIEINTCNNVHLGCQLGPAQVPSKDKHTLPSLYKFGLKRWEPPPVVALPFISLCTKSLAT